MKLQNKLAVITGASRGIGLAIANSCAREGAQLVICSRIKDNIEEAARQIRERYEVDVFPYVLNVSHMDTNLQHYSYLLHLLTTRLN